MKTSELRQIATEYLVPFFSGAEILATSVSSTAREQLVARIDPCTIGFKVARTDSARLRLRRSQQFAAQKSGEMTEKDVVEAFVEVLQGIEAGLQQPYREDLLASLDRRVVGKAIVDPHVERLLLKTLDQMSIWSSRLYEGQPITSAIGFIPNDNTKSVSLTDVWKHDFSAVITNGHDTIVTVNQNGQVVGHKSLPAPTQVPSFAPYRLAPLAEWASNGRLAVVLNRTGEIFAAARQEARFCSSLRRLAFSNSRGSLNSDGASARH